MYNSSFFNNTNRNKKCNKCNKKLPNNFRHKLCTNCHINDITDEICELITFSESVIITNHNLNYLKDYLSNNPVSIRLDLHNVLDTIDSGVKIGNYDNICCISFVGRKSAIRKLAADEIRKRINCQIKYGILIFKRGGNNFHEIGSKAWINNLIPVPINDTGIFIDDSQDHCESVESLNINGLKIHRLLRHENLTQILEQEYYSL